MRVFLDSSALVKRYIREPGTERVIQLCREADELLLSVLCAPEIISTFNRLRREEKLPMARYRQLKRDLALDLDQSTLIDLVPSVVNRAVSCLERAPLRTLDALQTASAIESFSDLFVTADRRQAAAAEKLGLKTEDVGVPS